MNCDTVIFDLDGTLLDTLDDLADSVNAIMLCRGYPIRSRDEVRSFVGEGYRLLIKRALPEGTDEDEVNMCTDLFRTEYFGNLVSKTKPYDGINELLAELKRKGIKIGVVSNKMDEAVKEACRHYFGNRIDSAVGDNPERNRKPSPDNIFEVLDQLNSNKEKTLFVGDSNIDVQTAKNAGLVCVGVSWGFRTKESLIKEGADHIIDKPHELLEYI